jgi:hypothetical protein
VQLDDDAQQHLLIDEMPPVKFATAHLHDTYQPQLCKDPSPPAPDRTGEHTWKIQALQEHV